MPVESQQLGQEVEVALQLFGVVVDEAYHSPQKGFIGVAQGHRIGVLGNDRDLSVLYQVFRDLERSRHPGEHSPVVADRVYQLTQQ